MAVRFDPSLVAGIVAELAARCVGRQVEALRLDRGRREAWLSLRPEPGEPGAIGLLLHPTRGFVVMDGSTVPRRENEARKIDFRRLFLTRVWAPSDERLLVFDLAGGARAEHPERAPVFRLFAELHTNQWNAVLTRGADDRVEAALWPRSAGGRSVRPGARYERPEGARAWSAEWPERSSWIARLESVPPGERRRAALHSIAWISSLNVDWVLGDAAVHEDPGALAGAYDRYVAIRKTSGEAWLLPRASGLQPYTVPLSADAVRCESLLEAMRVAAREAAARAAPDDETDAEPGTGPQATAEGARLERRLKRRIAALERRRASLARQLDGESPADLRTLGDLLLARKGDVPRGVPAVTLTGFDGRGIEVDLDPRLDAVGNAERFYDRARRRERAARVIPGRLRSTVERIARLQEGLEALSTAGPSAEVWALVGGRPEDGGRTGEEPRSREDAILPYRRFRSSGGLEIRVGRSSRANDALTFRHSKPDDIWLHARQAAGAHVILRWDQRDQNPPLADLTQAAVLAALHSEARHSSMVAVDWTRRKYVRKPRKAAPGAVVPERVSTLFVEPDAEIAKRLTPDDG